MMYSTRLIKPFWSSSSLSSSPTASALASACSCIGWRQQHEYLQQDSISRRQYRQQHSNDHHSYPHRKQQMQQQTQQQQQQQTMMVRTYVGKQLAEYYSQPSHHVVGKTSKLDNNPQLLSSLLGEWHWKRVFQQLYDQREGHWLTPVELFRPHYSYILADFCTSALLSSVPSSTSTSTTSSTPTPTSLSSSSSDHHHNHRRPLHLPPPPVEIIELGGGRGTNAELILSYLQENQPCLYDRLTYTIVDSSTTLHETQRKILGGAGGNSPHADKVRFQLMDLKDVAEGKIELLSKSETTPTVIMGMELLDNLPHDKIRRKTNTSIGRRSGGSSSSSNNGTTNASSDKDRTRLEQAEVHWNKTMSMYEEVFVPLSDPLLERVLRAVPSYVQPYPCWIPTVACGVLHHIIQQRPMVSIVLADFDWLPASDVNVVNNNNKDRSTATTTTALSTYADGEPIVTDMSGIDHECYLSAPSHCDILFPTDFDKLASFVRRTLSSSSSNERKSDNKKDDSNNNNKIGRRHRRPMATTTVVVEKQSDFLQRVGPQHVKSTKSWLSGDTPLLHDFVNCSVLTVTHSHNGGEEDK